MTEKSLVEIQKGETEFDIKFEEGKVKLSFGYDGKGVEAGVHANLKLEYFLDKLKAAIPGEVDDKIVDMLKIALKVV